MPDLRKTRLLNHPGLSKVAIAGWSSALFGLPFLAAGVLISLVAADVIEVDPSSIHAPRWVLGAIGAVFGLAGLMMITNGLLGVWRGRRLRLQGELHPGEPWYADHFWDPHGAREQRPGVFNGMFGGSIVLLFAAVGHGVLPEIGGWAWIVVGVMDLIAAWCVIYTVYTLVRALKYGRAEVRFGKFPFFLGTPLELSFITPPQVRDFRTLKFTLRFIEERYETHGTGKNRSTRVVCYQRYHDSFELKEGVDLPKKVTEVPVVFSLPDHAFESSVAARPATFWELEVVADAPGVDFKATFLLPVYREPGTVAEPLADDEFAEPAEAEDPRDLMRQRIERKLLGRGVTHS